MPITYPSPEGWADWSRSIEVIADYPSRLCELKVGDRVIGDETDLVNHVAVGVLGTVKNVNGNMISVELDLPLNVNPETLGGYFVINSTCYKSRWRKAKPQEDPKYNLLSTEYWQNMPVKVNKPSKEYTFEDVWKECVG